MKSIDNLRSGNANPKLIVQCEKMFHRFTFARCVRVFLATFVLACLFQFILIGLFGVFPNKFDFYHAIVQKQRAYLPIRQNYKTNEELIASYFRTKENELRLLNEEYRYMNDYYARNTLNNQTLIQNFNWTNDRLPYFFGKKNALYPGKCVQKINKKLIEILSI